VHANRRKETVSSNITFRVCGITVEKSLKHRKKTISDREKKRKRKLERTFVCYQLQKREKILREKNEENGSDEAIGI
jgi:phage-related protein